MIGDIFSILFALAGMICIILLAYYVSKWYGRKMLPFAGGKHIKVIDRLVVSKTGSILIVDILGKQYLIGVSDQNIQILTEMTVNIPVPMQKDNSFLDYFKKQRSID